MIPRMLLFCDWRGEQAADGAGFGCVSLALRDDSDLRKEGLLGTLWRWIGETVLMREKEWTPFLRFDLQGQTRRMRAVRGTFGARLGVCKWSVEGLLFKSICQHAARSIRTSGLFLDGPSCL